LAKSAVKKKIEHIAPRVGIYIEVPPIARSMSTLIWPDDAVAPEAHFLVRLQSGDVDAITDVYDRHHEALCSFASRLLGERQAAEDLVHDVFVVLPSVVHRFVPGTSLRAFLLGVTANRARRHVRAAARRRRMTERLANEPAPRRDDPEEQAHRKVLARRLANILDKLPHDQRIAFVLCDVEGNDCAAAAAILGIPHATMRTRLFYARQKVRAHLSREKNR
jgi:RNA polymerase sigma-70 factor (ECF subfamily)